MREVPTPYLLGIWVAWGELLDGPPPPLVGYTLGLPHLESWPIKEARILFCFLFGKGSKKKIFFIGTILVRFDCLRELGLEKFARSCP